LVLPSPAVNVQLERRTTVIPRRLDLAFTFLAAFGIFSPDARSSLFGDIVFEEDIWELALDASSPLDEFDPCLGVISVCTTDDGRGYLYFEGESPFIVYNVRVTSLPDGNTRFPLELQLRTMRRCGTVWGVTNLNNDSFVGIDVGCGDSAADDDRGRTDSGLPGVNRTEIVSASTEPGDEGAVPPSLLRKSGGRRIE
jgi:hypothetical protein